MIEVMYVSTIGENIKAARIRKGLTQQELAEALNTTKSAVSRYELGKREPRYRLLQEISSILGVMLLFSCKCYVLRVLKFPPESSNAIVASGTSAYK